MTETVDNHVVVVGCGGNIGASLIPHLARMSEVNRVTLIDRDVYEPANLRTQDIVPSDVGKAKALVLEKGWADPCRGEQQRVCHLAEHETSDKGW